MGQCMSPQNNETKLGDSMSQDDGSVFKAAQIHYAQETLAIDLSHQTPPTVEEMKIYTAALLATANGDNKLHPKEKKWIYGHQAAFGCPKNILDDIDELEKMSLEEVCAKFKAKPSLVKCTRVLLYHCLVASYAEADLSPDEIDAVKDVAVALNEKPSVVDDLVKVIEKERKVHAEMLAMIWGTGDSNTNPWQSS